MHDGPVLDGRERLPRGEEVRERGGDAPAVPLAVEAGEKLHRREEGRCVGDGLRVAEPDARLGGVEEGAGPETPNRRDFRAATTATPSEGSSTAFSASTAAATSSRR